MKTKYIKPSIVVTSVENQPLMATSNPQGYNSDIDLDGSNNTVSSSDDILSKRFSVWDED